MRYILITLVILILCIKSNAYTRDKLLLEYSFRQNSMSYEESQIPINNRNKELRIPDISGFSEAHGGIRGAGDMIRIPNSGNIITTKWSNDSIGLDVMSRAYIQDNKVPKDLLFTENNLDFAIPFIANSGEFTIELWMKYPVRTTTEVYASTISAAVIQHYEPYFAMNIRNVREIRFDITTGYTFGTRIYPYHMVCSQGVTTYVYPTNSSVGNKCAINVAQTPFQGLDVFHVVFTVKVINTGYRQPLMYIKQSVGSTKFNHIIFVENTQLSYNIIHPNDLFSPIPFNYKLSLFPFLTNDECPSCGTETISNTVYHARMYYKALNDSEIIQHFNEGPSNSKPACSSVVYTIPEDSILNVSIPGIYDFDNDLLKKTQSISMRFIVTVINGNLSYYTTSNNTLIPISASQTEQSIPSNSIIIFEHIPFTFGTNYLVLSFFPYDGVEKGFPCFITVHITHVNHKPTAIPSSGSIYPFLPTLVRLSYSDPDVNHVSGTIKSFTVYNVSSGVTLYTVSPIGSIGELVVSYPATITSSFIGFYYLTTNFTIDSNTSIVSSDLLYFSVTDSGDAISDISIVSLSILNNIQGGIFNQQTGEKYFAITTSQEDTPLLFTPDGFDTSNTFAILDYMIESLPTNSTIRSPLLDLDISTVPTRINAEYLPLQLKPDRDFNGTQTFQYHVISRSSGRRSTSVTHTTVFSEVNDPPVIHNNISGTSFMYHRADNWKMTLTDVDSDYKRFVTSISCAYNLAIVCPKESVRGVVDQNDFLESKGVCDDNPTPSLKFKSNKTMAIRVFNSIQIYCTGIGDFVIFVSVSDDESRDGDSRNTDSDVIIIKCIDNPDDSFLKTEVEGSIGWITMIVIIIIPCFIASIILVLLTTRILQLIFCKKLPTVSLCCYRNVYVYTNNAAYSALTWLSGTVVVIGLCLILVFFFMRVQPFERTMVADVFTVYKMYGTVAFDIVMIFVIFKCF